eukprot:Sdes_comp24468_c0_seq1m22380
MPSQTENPPLVGFRYEDQIYSDSSCQFSLFSCQNSSLFCIVKNTCFIESSKIFVFDRNSLRAILDSPTNHVSCITFLTHQTCAYIVAISENGQGFISAPLKIFVFDEDGSQSISTPTTLLSLNWLQSFSLEKSAEIQKVCSSIFHQQNVYFFSYSLHHLTIHRLSVNFSDNPFLSDSDQDFFQIELKNPL